ncbi:MAG: hypothetical protein M1820_000713 [Bogoriella megaspora]|nr:MAG: hypothetical protein M1820_000713 [Bogoriella megaspora]
MGQIYKNCSEVVMWLGERITLHPDTRTLEEGHDRLRRFLETGIFACDRVFSEDYEDLLAFSIFYILSSDRHFGELPCFADDGLSSYGISHLFKAGFEMLKHIMNLPYWSRIWIVQEIVLPPKAKIAYGSINAPWDVVSQAALIFENHGGSCCIDQCARLSETVKSVLSDFSFNVRVVELTRMHRQIESKIGLSWLLRQHFHRKATDSRDKLYGVLGLVNSWSEDFKIIPDYTKTAREVYEDLTIRSITSTESFDMLVGETMRNEHFPSWVADWGQSTNDYRWRWEVDRSSMYHYYGATKGRKLSAELMLGSKLKVEGLRVSTINAISPLMTASSLNDSSTVTCQELLAMANLTNDEKQKYAGGGVWSDAYRRTLCGDLMLGIQGGLDNTMRKATSEERRMYQLWKSAVQDEVYETPNASDLLAIERFQASVMRATRNRKFFIAQNGFLGLGPSDMQFADEVYLLTEP